MTDSVTKVDAFRDEVAHIEDVADLNRKRGTKKTTITKAQSFLEKLDTNPDSWNIADLVKKYDGPNIACNQYIIVAERIAAIEKVDFDADYDPQIADNTAVQLDFEKRQIIYTAHLRYVNLMERLESIYAQRELSRVWRQSSLSIASPMISGISSRKRLRFDQSSRFEIGEMKLRILLHAFV